MASATRRSGSANLASFLDALEARLCELTAEQVGAALLAHAERLVPAEREPFLAIFAEPGFDRRAARAPDAAGEPDPLLAEIDAFVERLRGGRYVDGWGWDPEIYEERAFGDESWVVEMDDLFAAANAVFLEGDMQLARETLGRLLTAFDLEGEAEAFCGPDSPQRMVSVDLGEAKARYLRATYETAPPSERPAALLDAIENLRFVGDDVSLAAIGEAKRVQLPDLDAFLPAWITHLSSVEDDAQQGSPSGRELPRLLSEAAEWHGGADGLGELARSRGAVDPEAHRDWVDALIRSGRLGDATAAAGEALRTLAPRGEVRAAIAERLARLAASTGDDDGALAARRERWCAAPSTSRLVALIDIATALGRADEVLAEEVGWALTAAEPDAEELGVTNARLLCELLLLAGRVDQALELAEEAGPLGWSHGAHPGPIVVPYLLVAATGPRIRPELLIAASFSGAPPQDDEPLLAQELEHIDVRGWVGGGDWDREPAELPLEDRYRGIPTDKLLPSYLLGTAIAARPGSQRERDRWLDRAAALVEERVGAIVGAKHRGAYERAARLAVACGEAIALARDRDRGFAFVIEARERFPRHHAFRSELDRATNASTYLPAPPRKSRR
ncbi:MAG: hypothetical protein LC790_00735 [Actinobacteria bacterium]|nr:hypothetical protein [Actinomycetota bacterium]